MARGQRKDAISIIASEVMQPRGLVGLGCDSLDYCGNEIHQVFSILADEEKYPVLVHCTQGKDRTGLIIMLVLLLCEIPLDIIAIDYLASERELQPEREERLVEIQSVGLGEEFVGCPPDFAEKVFMHIEGKYGGIMNYLEYAGIQEDMRSRVRSCLLETHPEHDG